MPMQTFLFTDIEGSTRLWNQAPVAMTAAVPRQEALLRELIAQWGGEVFKTVGDGVYAVFPRSPDAVAAAVAAQRAVRAADWPGLDDSGLAVRMALHTGEAGARDGDYFGPALNRLSRTLAAGHGGQILCTDDTLVACGEAWPDGIVLRDLGMRTLRDVPGNGRIFQLVAEGLPEQFPPLATLDPRVHNLPRWPTRLIGRETEVDRLRARLRSPDVRLVTLLGTGGVGKTRLATEVAAALLDEYQDGIRFVDLSALRDDAQVTPAIVQVTGAADPLLTPRDALLDWLRERQLLLVLDNCEQVVSGVAAIVSDILATAPQVGILATSRAPIRVRGERQVALQPLPTEPGPSTANAAVRLFAERAAEVNAAFTLDAETEPAVVGVCQIVDGLPLAIELAAAWTRLLTPAALHRRLQESRAILRDGARDLPDRQRALASTIAWSYDLLEPEDQRAFRRLAVFRGGISIDAAAAVLWEEGIDPPLWALTRLDALMQANLLQVASHDPSGEPRFVMLQTIQEFAIDILHTSGEWDRSSTAHAEYFATLANDAFAHYRTGDVALWFERLNREFENLRGAIEQFAGRGSPNPRGLEMAVSLWEFLDQCGHEREARAWLALFLDDDPAIPARLRARAQIRLGNSWLSNLEQAEQFYLEAAATARQAGEDDLLGFAEGSLARVKLLQGKIDDALPVFESLAEQVRASGDTARFGDALMQLAQARCEAGRYPEALTALDEAYALRLDPASNAWFDLIRGRVLRRMGQMEAALDALLQSRRVFASVEAMQNVASCLYEAAYLLLAADPSRARQCITEANDALKENPDPFAVVEALEANAELLASNDDVELAAKVLAASTRWRDMAGIVPPRFEQQERQSLDERIRAMIGPELYAACTVSGADLTLRAALDLVLAAVRTDIVTMV
jgi:predicted ATPase/predicted negative regulator of RcsB-dependent stress response